MPSDTPCAACHDNLWIHTALGQIALDEFRDPSLARGHFGYAFELGAPGVAPGFRGTAPTRQTRQSAVFRSHRRVVALPRFARAARRRPELRGRCEPGSRQALRDRRGDVADTARKSAKRRRRDVADFFDFNDFSDLQGFADRDRTTAERDPKAERMDRRLDAVDPVPTRRKAERSMSTWFRGGVFRVSSRVVPRGMDLTIAAEPTRAWVS